MIQCRLDFPKNLPGIPLSAETRHNIFLAFEEALANTLKHSGASQVTAEMTSQNGMFVISIADNGCGFNVETQIQATERGKGGHLGLSGMYDRLRTIGGECQITSSPGRGTIVKFILPRFKTNAR